MKRTRRVKRKPHGTLRKSRRYRRGGSPHSLRSTTHYSRSFGYLPRYLAESVNVTKGGKKRKRSSRRKRGGYTQKSSMFYAIRSGTH